MFEEEIIYIRKRLKGFGFSEYHNLQNVIKFAITPTYGFSIRYINENNLRCELNKKEVIGGMIFAGKVMTSTIISDWHTSKQRFKHIDDWIDNFLLIPEIKLLLRSRKINKICQNG